MNRPKKRIGTFAALVIAAVVMSSLILARFSGFEIPRILTEPTSIPTYEVTFNETGSGCGGLGSYVPSWYATLGNLTKVQPPSATLPLPNPEPSNSPSFATISMITFTVPDGGYPYYVVLGQDGTYNGTVVVAGSDVVVQIVGPLCNFQATG